MQYNLLSNPFCSQLTWLCLCPQACRGDKHDDPAMPCRVDDVVDSKVKTNEVQVDAGVVHTVPAAADFIMCYSVAEGESILKHLTCS